MEGDASESDSMLKSLSFSEGTLEPEFNSSVYEYSLQLEPEIAEFIVTAEVYNIYSTVEGDGTIKVSGNTKQIAVTCTDLYGNQKVYTINLLGTIDTESMDMGDYTYVPYFDEKNLPDTFTTELVNLADVQARGIYSEIFDVEAVCMEDSDGNQDFYVLQNGQVSDQNVIVTELTGKQFIFMPLTVDLKLRSGFTWTTAEIEQQQLPGWKYNDGEENFFQMYLRNEEKEDCIYQYDIQEKTLQKFDERMMISSEAYEDEVDVLNKEAKMKNLKYTIIFLILTALGGVVCIGVLYLQNTTWGERYRERRQKKA